MMVRPLCVRAEGIVRVARIQKHNQAAGCLHRQPMGIRRIQRHVICFTQPIQLGVMAVGLFRNRRNDWQLPGSLLSVNATHTGGGGRDRHSAPSRELLRTPPPAEDAGAGRPGAPPRPAVRKGPTTAVPLLIGAVLVLWLLLALSGHN